MLTSELELLKEQLALLKAKQFGRSSEKLKQQIDNLELVIEEKEIEHKTKAKVEGDRKQPKRLPLLEDLPNITIIYRCIDKVKYMREKELRFQEVR